MTETVTVLTPTGEFEQSASGEPTPVVTSDETVMYLEPQDDVRRSTEALEVGYVSTGLWLGVGLATYPFNEHQQIVWSGKVFDILAPPRVMPNPRLHTLSHTELVLQVVEGTEAHVSDAVAHPAAVQGEGA